MTKAKPQKTKPADGVGDTLTIKQEAFCQAYVEIGNASEAYRRTYDASNMKPETVNRKAVELQSHGKITARVAELRAQLRQRHEITADTLVQELEEARLLARNISSAAAMVSATMGKGKLLGLIIDRAEHTGKDGEKLLPENVNSRDMARTILEILRDAQVEPVDDDDDEREIEVGHGPRPTSTPARGGSCSAPRAGYADNASTAVRRVYNPKSKRFE